MSDPLMEEIWRVREQLLVEHGGMEGLLKEVKKIERARLRKSTASKNRSPKSVATVKTTKRKAKHAKS